MIIYDDDYPRARLKTSPFRMEVPVISSRHILARDWDMLQREDLFVSNSHTVIIIIEDGPDEWSDYSRAFQGVVNFFYSRGYRYLRFDEDSGDIVTQLRLYR